MAHQIGQKYGRWSVRAKGNSTDGRYHLLPGITWPDSEDWPEDGEIDYAEGNCGANKISFFLHFGNGTSNGAQTQGSISINTNDWHWYEMEWAPTYVRGWCDGVQYFSDTNTSHFNYSSGHHQTVQLDWFPDGAGSTGVGEMRVDTFIMYSHPSSIPS